MELVLESFRQGELILEARSSLERKQQGQFLTPLPIARYMARQLGAIRDGDRILDPAIGSGVLVCAVIERVLSERDANSPPMQLWVDGYDIDSELATVARQALEIAEQEAAKWGVQIHYKVRESDFILANHSLGPLFAENELDRYDHIIANPPYFKLRRDDARVKAMSRRSSGNTNIYTLFIARSLEMMRDDARACFIVPRSFCSGAYFSKFRQRFIREAKPRAVHLFESRDSLFGSGKVLQENIIVTFQPRRAEREEERRPGVMISASENVDDLNDLSLRIRVGDSLFFSYLNGSLFFRLPTSDLDCEIATVIDAWEGSLQEYGLDVSTGPVVVFRNRDHLRDVKTTENGDAVPLLWMRNIRPQSIVWPLDTYHKPQAIAATAGDKLLVSTQNYVLLRRFSAKEEPRRLIPAPFLKKVFIDQFAHIGFENHLNYIYREEGELSADEALGLSTLLASALVDRYFRILNGNTQVNALELRSLPLPPMDVIVKIGRAVQAPERKGDIDDIVFAILREAGFLSDAIPKIKETRFTMGKIQEAQNVLETLGLPRAQQNEISALTLLVLAGLSEDTPWCEVSAPRLRIHDILVAIASDYDREYAENTRETIRRQVIHQFEQAGIVTRNPDDLTLATNSPKTHYALTDRIVEVLSTYGSVEWRDAVKEFMRDRPALIEMYQQRRDQHKVPVELPAGETLNLSPGDHNELQSKIVEEFGARFVPGGRLLYLGDTAKKKLLLDEEMFAKLGVAAPDHNKLPDVVFYDEKRDWVFLVEAVTSHGPMSPKRIIELRDMFLNCESGLIYVTAFFDFRTFREFAGDIAWETEVWLAEMPGHLIHYNGDRFVGPRE